MGKPLRVLIVEDSEEDSLLMLRELKRGGYDPVHDRVETAKAMKAALKKQTWDLILCDYVMPRFSAPDALKTLKESGLDIPFIIVSGSIGEDTAVAAMKAGAHDYMMKNNLKRLVPAVEQELRAAEVRGKLSESEKALQESEKRYRQVVESATEIIYTVDEKGNFTYGNPAGLKATGYSLEELRKLNYGDLVLPEHRERVMEIYINQFRQRMPTTHIEFPFFNKAGRIIWFGQNTSLVIEDGKVVGFHIIARDITERKKAEEALKESEEKYRLLVENANEAIFVIQDGMLRFFNIKNIELIGYSKEELTSAPYINFVHPDDRQTVFERYLKRIKGEELPGVNVFRIVDKAGNIRWVEVNSVLISWEGRPATLNFLNDITERKRMEDALRESEERYRTILEAIEEGYYEVDFNGNFTFFNDSLCRMLGYTRDELMGMSNRQYMDKETAKKVYQVFNQLYTTGEPYKAFDWEIIRKDGTKRFHDSSVSLIRNAKGEKIGFRGIARDITERKRAEGALQKSEERFRELYNNAPVGYHEFDIEGRITSVNRTELEMLGYTLEERIGQFVWSSITEEDKSRQTVLGKLAGVIPPSRSLERTYRRKDGTTFAALIQDQLFRDRDGRIAGMRSTIQDITERKRAEEAVLENERRFKALYDDAPVGYFEYDTLGRITRVNRTELEMLGYTVAEMIGQPVWKFIVEEEIARKLILAKLAGTMPPSRSLERTYRRKDGTTFPGLVQDRLLRDSEGKIIGLRATIQDITELKRAEEALRASENKYRTLIDNVPQKIFLKDKDSVYISCNENYAQDLKIKPDEIFERTDYDFYPKDLAEKYRADDKRIMEAGRTEELEEKYIQNEQEMWVNTIKTPVKDEEGNIIGVLGIFWDITERKKAEQDMMVLQEQLRQSQKMEAIGRLAGGIAHDFNNLLTIIKGYSQLSLMELKEKDPMRGNIEEIKRAADRAADLTRQLLAFSRRQILEMRVLDLNTVLRDLDKMLRRVIGEDIELVTLLAEDLGRVKTDPGQMQQVIMNLAVNARDAMPKGGKLTIETANVELDETYARSHVAVIPGRHVMLSVSDTGVGMTAEVKEQVFEPFFTTKEKGKGTGLGLSTVYGIVKQSGGNIWVYSEPGQGTTFKIYLPRVDEPLEELKEKVEVKEIPRGSETILVVEDEEKVRKLAVRILRGQGYAVLEAPHGDDALLVCGQHEGPIHLMVTDVVMPNMSGHELAKRLKPFHPEMKVLYMSGYTDNAIVHHGVLEKRMNYIQKPFTVDGLARKVREVLDK